MVSPKLDSGLIRGGWNIGLVSERYDLSRASWLSTFLKLITTHSIGFRK
jgi:hypothetical protein